ncbi:hypothetical protein [Streptomyces chiangmaiensis]|uniref:Uncharacterized protein n=1 Tax=Streptomyces chiangmaiensis TaxID=766497 RepID=A0ABU7FE43_9ACTN|nr:hypothetical protein [Streptomyces chiangmaiensis]MED7822160.1 hypothetical protein [Streptomyces chiangmaiensis]
MKQIDSAEVPAATPALKLAGGCLAGVLVLLAGLLIALSFGSTVEIESPDQFAGLRDNDSSVALVVLILGVVALPATRIQRRQAVAGLINQYHRAS